MRALGTLDLTVLHNNWLFLSQVGRTQAILINPAMVDILAETGDPGDYLGLSRRIQVRLAQTEVQPGDMLLFCEQPPASWTVSNLAGSCSLSMPQVKRRLLNQVTGSLETLLIKFVDGIGDAHAGNWSDNADQTPLESGSTASAWPEETLPDLREIPQAEEPTQSIIPSEAQANNDDSEPFEEDFPTDAYDSQAQEAYPTNNR